MELRAAVGLQHGGRGYGVCGSERGGLSGWSSSVAPRLGNLSLLGDARLLGRRGVRGSVLVLRCSSEVGRGAGAERLIDERSYMGLEDVTPRDEDFDFWEYEASQHSEVVDVQDVKTEGAEDWVAGEDVSPVDESETPYVRPEFVVPKIKYTRESKGLKPSYRVFSRDRQTVPKPRINPYSVLMKMIDPANDDEYLDSDSRLESLEKLGDGESVAHDMGSSASNFTTATGKEVYDRTTAFNGRQKDWNGTSKEEMRLYMSDLDEVEIDVLEGEEALSVEDGDMLRNLNSDIVLGVVSSFGGSEDLDSQGGGQDELQLRTEENIDEGGHELVTGYDHTGVRLSGIWSDSEDEDDDLDNFDDTDFDKHSIAESVKEEAADGDDPLRRFLNSRSGNRDSKQEGRVFKYNKSVKKTDGVHLNRAELYLSGSSASGKKVLHPASNLKVNQGSEKQTETSAMREVLQIAYNLPKNRALEDYMAPFMSKFSNIQANLILEALCGDDLTDQVISFFRWMRSHDPCLWNSRSFSLLFTFLGRMGMPDEALVHFEMLPEDKQFHSVEVYNTLITCLTNCNRQDEVPSILEKMKTLGNEPDAVTFSILMNSAVKGGRSLQEVWALYQDMGERGVTPSVNVFGTLIKAFCEEGRLKEALLVTTEMEKLKIPFNVVIYNMLINAYGKAGKLEEAEGLMTEMQQRGIQPNVGTYNTLIFSYLESKQFTVAEGLVEEMESLGLLPDVVTFTTLLGAYGHEGKTEQAAQVFSRMEARGIQPNSHTYTALINAYSAGRWPEKAVRAFEMMQRRGISPTVESFTALLDAYRRVGDLEMVNTVWKTMKKEGCVATRVTYMTILDAYQKKGRYKEARDLIEEFKNQGHKPDLMVYNMLLNSYMRGGRHLRAPEIVQEMKAAGFLPDSFTYCTLIYGYLRVRDHTMALKYRREMMNRGQLPDAKTYAKLRAILKVIEGRRDVNNYKSQKGKPSRPPRKDSEKAKSYWKRDK
ncbi:hypothetical protein KC19_1G325100 [Ceratodon purpureus]|uniref:Pentatricopeptide repeat-containing protein n=1 Tax=Ceratodon purpureus TaxID=3225 RepID=A0A8T0JEQ7_CERPU|nr:hypothetical protein KC19_1G325100 [Ceratodon purpureus]